ncbi:MAG: alpha/beta fold hydrolase [Dokdonella sp.]
MTAPSSSHAVQSGIAPATAPSAQAGFFGTSERRRFGWLHRPAAATADVGLVIVPPFGYEAICAQRSLRHLAEQAAHAGLIAVRFDLDGCGDSVGDDLEPDRVDAWLTSVSDACDLARQAGATRIVLVGVRLGALLAVRAAERRDDVSGVVAIAAPASGKAFVREGRALQMALGLATPPNAAGAHDESVHELIGFALTEQTRTALAQIDLKLDTQRPAPAVLLLDRDDLAGNDAWAAHLRALGVDVDQRRLPGYVEMMLDPHRAEVPQAILNATVAFAAQRPSLPTAPSPRPSIELCTRATIAIGAETVVEEVAAIDDSLRGVVTRPQTGEARRALILLNAGGIGRIGPNRLGVAFARELATRGYLVLRVDQSGIGDSDTRKGGIENTVYSEQAVDDVGVAVAWVRQSGVSEVTVAGLCSGAYHALKAAQAAQPINAIIAINPLTFDYQPGMPLDFAAFRVTADAARYNNAMRSAQSWRKVLRGQVDFRRVARVVAHRVGSLVGRHAKNVLRRLRVPLPNDLGSALLGIGRRGVAMHFLFAASDPGYTMLRDQGGTAVKRLIEDGRLGIRIIDGPDHTFTPRWSHPELFEAMLAVLP